MFFCSGLLLFFLGVVVVPSVAVSQIQDIASYQYCSKPDTLAEKRTIPALPKDTTAELVHVQTLFRHGARTLLDPPDICWKGYDPKWECDVHEYVTGHHKDSPLDYNLHAVNDVAPWGRTLPDKCARYNLLNEGVDQHLITGEMAGRAYLLGEVFNLTSQDKENEQPTVNASSESTPRNFSAVIEDMSQHLRQGKNIDHLIYFRSSDRQRTRLSGISFITSFLRQLDPSPSPSVNLTMHMMEPLRETLLPNEHECPLLEELFHDAQQTLVKPEYAEAINFVRPLWNVDMNDIHIWPAPFCDCMFTTICNNGSLPERWSVAEVDRALKAATEAYSLRWLYRNAIISKLSMLRLAVELKSLILRAFPAHWDLLLPNPEDRAAYNNLLSEQTHLSSYVPIAVFSAHDTTLLPLLATFGPQMVEASAEDGNRWPPYASMLNFEYYQDDKEPLFRIVYDNRVLTSFVKGCEKHEHLCPVKFLFSALSWATTEDAKHLNSCHKKDMMEKLAGEPTTTPALRRQQPIASHAS